jgi:adenosylcobinamide-GDP ribazoletransferase
VQFLTRIPITGIPDKAYDEWGARRRALAFYPLVGVLVGGLGGAVWLAARWLQIPDFAAAILAVAATSVVTGAFHEDGLADTADALGPHTREDALRVMRDSRIGTFGAVALWTALTLKVAALVGTAATDVPITLFAAHVLARWAALPLIVLVPSARSQDGLGSGVAAIATWREVLLATVFAVACAVLFLDVLRAVWCLAVAVILMAATGLAYRRRFGGITGDCLGATNQIVEVAVLLVVSAMR